ncbi:MAG: NYN domain-containing protein [Gammaproteobacteria bacterium]|nr:NYN domain-containing protein [Gammaproteobacteria bacterium]
MDTAVYIDGYNLFYGRLRATPYKWLDIVKLSELIIKIQSPESSILKVKYFTAPIKANFSSHGQLSVQSQTNYNRALAHLYPGRIEIINGYQTVEKGTPPRYKRPIDKDDRVEVWKFEEKQTDVNLALHLYRDAILGQYSQQVVVSNDTDLELALKLVKQDTPNIQLGLIVPLREGNHSYPNKSLSDQSDWTRRHILNAECEKCLLPNTIPTNKKPIIKPSYW